MQSLVLRLLGVAALGVVGCGDSGEATPCTPGESQACACPSGDQGAQSCKENGSGFDVCVCEGAGGGPPGVGGNGSGGGPECAPGEERDCYEGPLGTENVGLCAGGTQTCQSTKLWGDCAGQIVPTTDLCISPEDEDCDGQPPDCPAAWHVIVGEGSTTGGASDVAVGPDDSVVVVGWFAGTMTLDGQSYTAPATGDGYVIKITPAGDIDWVYLITGLGAQVPNSVAVGPNGEVVVGGYFFSEADFGLGQPTQSLGQADAFLVGLQGDGTPDWLEVMGSAADQNNLEQIRDIAIDANGNIAVIGVYTGLTDFAGEELPVANSGAMTVIAKLDDQHSMVFHRTGVLGYSNVTFLPDGDLVASVQKQVGVPLDLGDGNIPEEAVVARFADAGDLVWAFPFGASSGSSQVIASVGGLSSLDTDSTLFFLSGYGIGLDLGGGVLPQGGIFQVSLTATGEHAQSGSLGDLGDMFSIAAARAPDGSAVIGGWFYGGSSFTVAGDTYTTDGPNNGDAFLIRAAADGSLVGARTFGTEGSTISIQSVGVDSTGSVVLMASYGGDGIDLGTGTLPPASGGAGVVARIIW